MEQDNKVSLMLAAIDKSISQTIPQLTQEDARGKNYIIYGQDNTYPNYLYGLYADVSTLKTIIDGTAAYIAGDDAKSIVPGFETTINKKGDTWRNFIKLLGRDYNLYGGCSYNVIRNKRGDISELYYIDFRNLRTDKKNETFYYSEEYTKKYSRSSKVLVYPRFIPGARNVPSSIVYVKNEYTTPYPVPRYSGAIKACEIERNIDEMHLASLQNGFMGSYLINFLNGIPTDEQKAEIEKNVAEKFSSTHNAGRILLNFANGKDNMAILQKLEISDFGEKYKAAANRSREQIYCAFQAIPQLFGLMTDNKGFSEAEFVEAFRLYNGTVVKDIQRTLCDSFDYVLSTKGSVTIKPFSLESKEEESEPNNIN